MYAENARKAVGGLVKILLADIAHVYPAVLALYAGLQPAKRPLHVVNERPLEIGAVQPLQMYLGVSDKQYLFHC